MDNALGDFLRARRELVAPVEVGLPESGALRRVPGLRREEVAMLAGISVEYYVRLERGRDRTPSPSVVAALARALQLDAEGADYLMALAGRNAPIPRARPESRPPHDLVLLLEGIDAPAMIVNRYTDVLASNRAAQALSPGMRPGVNRLLWEFTDPMARETDPRWEQTTAAAIAHLRARTGTDSGDERLHSLVGELSVRSERFRRLWARHDVHAATGGSVVVLHPEAGELQLLAVKLLYPGAGGLELLALQPEPGSATARALAALTAQHS